VKIAVIYPGPMFSVRDVAAGYHAALAYAGHDVIQIDMPKRMAIFERVVRTEFQEVPAKEDKLWLATRLASENAVVECLRHEPDVVLIVSLMYVHPDILVLLRRAGFPVAILLTESPYDDENQIKIAAQADLAFVTERCNLDAYRDVLPNSHYLPHAHDPHIHRPIRTHDEEAFDVFLVATGFKGRVDLLEAVDWTGIDFRLFGQWHLDDDSPLQPHVFDAVISNERVPRWYSRARININLHREDDGWGVYHVGKKVLGAWSANPRSYEIAACGGFQIADNSRPELEAIFGSSVPTFDDGEQLGELIRYYLREPGRRQALADEAKTKVQPHTFAARTEMVVEELGAIAV